MIWGSNIKKPANFWKKSSDENVKCLLCPRECVISPGDLGYCQGRKNIDGGLYTINYGEATSANPDPIEKKPLYHFHPGTRAFSMSTAGCNFECKHCFPPNVTVFTDQGIRTVEEIFESSKNERVVSHKGSFAPVKKAFKHQYEGKIVDITPYYLPDIQCTPGHELFVTEDPSSGEVEKVKAGDITDDYFLAVPKVSVQDKEELNSKEILEKFDSTPFKRNREIMREGFDRMKKMKAEGRTSKEIAKSFSTNPAYVRNLFVKFKREGEDAFRESYPTSLVENDGRVRFKNEKSDGLKRYIEITPDFAKLLGIYCAEGCVREHPDRPNSCDMVFSFGHEEELIEEVKQLLWKVFEVKPSVQEETTSTKVCVKKTSLAVLFKMLSGDKAENKQVPSFLFEGSDSIAKSFLKGYFEGDGSFKERYTDALTISRKLALGVYQIFLNQGVLPSFYFHRPSEEKRIEGRKVHQNPYYIVRVPEKFDFDSEGWKRGGRARSLGDEDYYYSPIRSISVKNYSGPVYNLEVKGDHSYNASFAAVSNCQNWRISQSSVDGIRTEEIEPEEAIRKAKNMDCQGIAYTYGEPVIWFEYALDTAELAHEEGLYNVFVTNGYMNLDAWKELGPYLDGMNVDMKAINDEFYREVCGVPSVEPVLETCEWAVENGIHLELTNLVIPGENDDPEDIRELCRWIVESLGPEVPIHFSRFRPMYKMMDKEPTPVETLEKALKIAEDEGLKHIYVGNVPGHEADNTYCPECGELLVSRYGFSVSEYNLENGRCPECGTEVNIVGDYEFPSGS